MLSDPNTFLHTISLHADTPYGHKGALTLTQTHRHPPHTPFTGSQKASRGNTNSHTVTQALTLTLYCHQRMVNAGSHRAFFD